ncbi:MAG TPA: phosphoenolpyruvate--protein phosphotransferase [Elusimicrobia bacterium]|jgi:phosphotransferase system enzyme I (PtsI)|nr:phosphoenolpyruvate--protein phosphotransferase [Elusimicrobiota bacterium]
MLKGIPASSGIAIGKVFLFLEEEDLSIYPRSLSQEEIKNELRRFREAVSSVRQEILQTKDKVLRSLGKEHSRLIDAHLLILDDPLLTRDVPKKITSSALNADWVVYEVTEKVIKTLETVEDSYFRERTEDILALRRKIVRYLLGKEKTFLINLPGNAIVVAHNLAPGDTVNLKEEKVIGFATDVGGRTSHTALLAQSFEIPAVVGLKNITRQVRNGDTLIIDGNEGVVTVNPDDQTVKIYQEKLKEYLYKKEELQKLVKLKATTLDGRSINLAANIERPEEIELVLHYGAEGIGLYRTEFLYLDRIDLPSEKEQYENYLKVAKNVYPHSVVIRTLDLGGDKLFPQIAELKGISLTERNPFLGLRSIRFCLRYPEILKVQLRAILRASVEGKLKILFPMVSRIEELHQVKKILEETKQSLREENIPFDEKIEIGVLIEVPAAALITSLVAEEVDFLSIGTNDLIQYTLAVDRGNENVANLYDPAHPSILRLIKQIIVAAQRASKWIGTCGEMVADPVFTIMFVGMGINGLSVPASVVPKVKKIIREFSYSEAEKLAEEITSAEDKKTIEEIAQKINEKYS